MGVRLTLLEAPARLPEHGFGKLNLDASLTQQPVLNRVEWKISDAPVAYPDALAEMEARAQAIAQGTAGEQVWLLESAHLPPASSAKARPHRARFASIAAARRQFTIMVRASAWRVRAQSQTRSPDVRAHVRIWSNG
jgi:hypothetical protein